MLRFIGAIPKEFCT